MEPINFQLHKRFVTTYASYQSNAIGLGTIPKLYNHIETVPYTMYILRRMLYHTKVKLVDESFLGIA